MTTMIEPFFGMSHMYDTVQALLRVRESDATYPPPVDVDYGVGEFIEWLMSEETIGRWVAVIDGEVAGHISLTDPHKYLTGFLDSADYESDSMNGFCEVSKFFVNPKFQSHGVGALLFNHAIEFARSKALQPALAVIDTSSAARRFYAKKGMREVGSFNGVHGENFVFVDELPVPTVVITMTPALVTV
jgi:GNAT superfamily N-acetyltransferase